MTLTDDCTRKVWEYILKEKNDVSTRLIEWVRSPPAAAEDMGRGRREKRAPIRRDPVNFIGDGELNDASTFITVDIPEPKTFKQAMASAEHDQWIAAMAK